jgi:hypothetical protein
VQLINASHFESMSLLDRLAKQLEVDMVARNARAILKKENEMLDNLIERAKEFTNKTVGEEFVDDLNSWVDDLVGYREINQQLIDMDDKAFDAALRAEITLLEGMRNFITSQSEAAEYWRNKLAGDIDTSKALL